MDCGWERIKNEVYAFAVGKKKCLPSYFKRILEAYPEESAKLIRCCFEDMPAEQRLLCLSVRGKNDPKGIVKEVEKLLAELEPEDMGTAFAVLSSVPSKESEDLLCSYLDHENWRLKMKAASALGEMEALRCAPRIREAAEKCDATVKAGLLAIADRMERK